MRASSMQAPSPTTVPAPIGAGSTVMNGNTAESAGTITTYLISLDDKIGLEKD
jgi:hypothetical protein